MTVVGTFEDARSQAAGLVGLVPTMGFLHEGHLSHVERARQECDTVLVSLFVNPLQFDVPEDLDRYPRDPERDVRLVTEAGADLLFAPEQAVMYPQPPLTRVRVPLLEEEMEGAHRPGHFEGVATVVTKLLGGLQPDRAYFGRKDAQQLAVIRRLVYDLSLPVQIVGGPTVREEDGLALSSRNVFLGPEERERALGLFRGLMAAADAVEQGRRDADALEGLVLDETRDIDVEYVTLADADLAARLDRLDRPAFLAVAARVGSTRLIDNLAVDFDQSGNPVVDRGRRLTGPSILYGEG